MDFITALVLASRQLSWFRTTECFNFWPFYMIMFLNFLNPLWRQVIYDWPLHPANVAAELEKTCNCYDLLKLSQFCAIHCLSLVLDGVKLPPFCLGVLIQLHIQSKPLLVLDGAEDDFLVSIFEARIAFFYFGSFIIAVFLVQLRYCSQ